MKMTPYSVYWTPPGIYITRGFIHYLDTQGHHFVEEDDLFLKLLQLFDKSKKNKVRFKWIE